MRSGRVLPALLLTALALSAAGPAVAQTAPPPTPGTGQAQPTTVSIGVSQAAGVYTFTGVVGPAVTGVQVTIARLGTDGRVTGIASTRTVEGGRYEIRTSLPVGFASYYALTAATPEQQAGRSRLYGLIVNTRPGVPATPTVSLHVQRGTDGYVFRGFLDPARSVPLTLARHVGGRLVGVIGTRTSPGGAFAIGLPLGPGTYYFQVLTGAANGLTAASSRVYGLVVPGPAPARPAAVAPVHAGTYAGAYLVVVSDPSDPRLQAAAASARRAGYVASTRSLGCDVGAARGLGRAASADEYVSAVYFHTDTAARQFAALHPPVEAGVVRVRTLCLD